MTLYRAQQAMMMKSSRRKRGPWDANDQRQYLHDGFRRADKNQRQNQELPIC